MDRFETDAGQIYAGEFMIATGLGTDTWFAPNTEDLKRHYGGDPHKFRGILVVTTLWQEVGWGTILYLAAISNIDPRLYEASVIDGAGKWRQTPTHHPAGHHLRDRDPVDFPGRRAAERRLRADSVALLAAGVRAGGHSRHLRVLLGDHQPEVLVRHRGGPISRRCSRPSCCSAPT